jgi:hypothetical protein
MGKSAHGDSKVKLANIMARADNRCLVKRVAAGLPALLIASSAALAESKNLFLGAIT